MERASASDSCCNVNERDKMVDQEHVLCYLYSISDSSWINDRDKLTTMLCLYMHCSDDIAMLLFLKPSDVLFLKQYLPNIKP